MSRPDLPGLRDSLGVMVYTFARIGAVLQMKVRDYFVQGRGGWPAYMKKAGKSMKCLATTKLENLLDAYIAAAGPRRRPLPASKRRSATTRSAPPASPRISRTAARSKSRNRSPITRRRARPNCMIDGRIRFPWMKSRGLQFRVAAISVPSREMAFLAGRSPRKGQASRIRLGDFYRVVRYPCISSVRVQPDVVLPFTTA